MFYVAKTKKTSQIYQREIKSGAIPSNGKGLMSRGRRGQPKPTIHDTFATRNDTNIT